MVYRPSSILSGLSPVFESLSEKLQGAFARLGRKGKLTEQDVDEALRELRIALLEADVDFRVVKSFVAAIRERAVGEQVLSGLNQVQQVVKVVNDQLVEMLGAEPSRLSAAATPPTVVMLVGLQGSGKTTTAAKLAQQLRKAGNRPLLVACDPYRPAAIRQLQTLGKQVDVPVLADEHKKPPELAQAAVRQAQGEGLNYVLLDTAGRLHIDEDLMQEVSEIRQRVQPQEVLLVADAMTGQDAVKMASAFNEQVGLTGVILTKLDGDARGGAALSLRAVTGLPIKYVGVGEKLDAIEPFHPDRVASRILGMGDVLTLIERAQETVDQEQARQLEKKLRSATFDLEDFLAQLNQAKKMGPLDQLVKLIPGVSGALKGQPLPSFEDKQFKRIEAIILSMTPKERRHPEIIGGSRKRRIAQGSGTTPADINQLLNQFRQMQKMVKQLSQAQSGPGKRGLGGPLQW
jgi:signal recognition particle subunit SRP54